MDSNVKNKEKDPHQTNVKGSNSKDAGKEKDSKLNINDSNSVKKDDADKFKKYENEGIVFKAKLIGSELVLEPKGDKMCQNSIQRLKAIIKGTNSHKKRIVMKISFDGVKIYDEKTNEILHHHEVAHISYIASDDTDSRTFGYVCDVPNKAHLFICFKTSGPAINVMTEISALFEACLERKKQKGNKKVLDNQDSSVDASSQAQDDLIGDSGIMDGDISGIGSEEKQQQPQQQNQLKSKLSSIFDDDLASLGDSFNASSSFVTTQTNNNNNVAINNNVSANNGDIVSRDKSQSGSLSNLKGTKLQTSADAGFEDIFAGLSDPIIVDKNDSLISYKPQSAVANAEISGNVLSAASRARSSESRPIPSRGQQQSNNRENPILLPPPSSLPRQVQMLSNAASMSSGNQQGRLALGTGNHNRSLIYNHSSVSLSDAALTRQLSYTLPTSSVNQQQTAEGDRYAVFNDIDSMPSIFEATLNSSFGSSSKQPRFVAGGHSTSVLAGGPFGTSNQMQQVSGFSAPSAGAQFQTQQQQQQQFQQQFNQQQQFQYQPQQQQRQVHQFQQANQQNQHTMMFSMDPSSSFGAPNNPPVSSTPVAPTPFGTNSIPTGAASDFMRPTQSQQAPISQRQQASGKIQAFAAAPAASIDSSQLRQPNPFDDDFFN